MIEISLLIILKILLKIIIATIDMRFVFLVQSFMLQDENNRQSNLLKSTTMPYNPDMSSIDNNLKGSKLLMFQQLFMRVVT